MSVKFGDSIVTKGLVLYLNSDQKNYVLSEVEVLVVAGGGSGGDCKDNGGTPAGGGGAGGLIYSYSYPVSSGSAIVVTVGNGGIKPLAQKIGNNGQNSVFGNLVSQGGGGGGSDDLAGPHGSGEQQRRRGNNGGSGGGSGNSTVNRTSGVSDQGFGGGGSTNGAGGGGGAGERGHDSDWMEVSGRGGNGKVFSISGSPVYYGGGGGGGGYVNLSAGPGGIGGGGNGANSAGGSVSNAQSGTNGLGSGGGGGSANGGGQSDGGAGGSGIVIVRYPGPQKATGGNTITNVGGYTIHTFTTSGTFTPLAVPANGGAVYGLQNLSGSEYSTTVNTTHVVYNNSNGGHLTFSGDGTTAQGGNIVGAAPLLSSANTVEFAVFTPGSNYQILTNSFYSYGESDRVYSKNGSTNIVLGSTVNSWNMFSVTFNGTNTVTGYKNGVLGNTSSSFDFSGLTGDLPIGARPWSPYVQNFKLGYIRIYNRVLTATEIQQNFNAQRGRFGL